MKFDTLNSIFAMMSPSDYIGAVNSKVGDAKDRDSWIRILQRYLFAKGSGVYSGNDLIANIKKLSSKTNNEQLKQFRQVISIITSTDTLKIGTQHEWPYKVVLQNNKEKEIRNVTNTYEILNKSEANIVKDLNKQFTIITNNCPFIGPQTRDAEDAELFINFTPTHIMSRCVPFVELDFIFLRKASKNEAGNYYNTPSLMKFLIGPELSSDSLNAKIVDSRLKKVDESYYQSSGMELFTSPQTLINLDEAANNKRYNKVLDPFRPFMTLEGVNIDIAPSKGIYNFKKASVKIRLHDRTRLSEISDLIRPQYYTQTTIWIAFGWRHPVEPGNPYADFINSRMYKREAYGIQNCSFQFDDTGQVSISLELYTKNSFELISNRISDSANSFDQLESRWRKLSEDIANLSKDLTKELDTGSEEVRPIQIITAASSGTFPGMEISQIQKIITNLENSLKGNSKSSISKEQLKKLVEKLREYYSASLNEKKQQKFNYELQKNRAAQEVTKKRLQELESGLDPWKWTEEKDTAYVKETGRTSRAYLLGMYKKDKKTALTQKLIDNLKKNGGIDVKNDIISFGKVISTYLGSNMLTFPGVDELQLVFYKLNDNCCEASGINIAEFPVEVSVLLSNYKEEVNLKGTDKLSLSDFLNLVVRSSFEDLRSIAYGFNKFYNPYDPNDMSAKIANGKAEEHDNRMSGLISNFGRFIKPEIEMFIETCFAIKNPEDAVLDGAQIYSHPLDSGGRLDKNKEYTRVFRIHIFDKTFKPYQDVDTILNNAKDLKDKAIKNYQTQNPPQFSYNVIKELVDKKVITENLKLIAPRQKLIDEISKTIPTIVHGLSTSIIQTANLSSKQDPKLTAAQLTGLNQNKVNTLDSAGSMHGFLPLRIIPASLSMQLLGCPIMNYMQHFFINFNTGTTADNVYAITGISHAISPGSFISNVTFTFADAYGKYEAATADFDQQLKALEKIANSAK